LNFCTLMSFSFPRSKLTSFSYTAALRTRKPFNSDHISDSYSSTTLFYTVCSASSESVDVSKFSVCFHKLRISSTPTSSSPYLILISAKSFPDSVILPSYTFCILETSPSLSENCLLIAIWSDMKRDMSV
jgi:hypothetical protein